MCKWKAYQSSRVTMELPVVNHEDYFAKIGDDHKFPINKFGELANYLIQNKIVKKFHKPSPCSFETLSYAHSKNYISDIKNKTLSTQVMMEERVIAYLMMLQLRHIIYLIEVLLIKF